MTYLGQRRRLGALFAMVLGLLGPVVARSEPLPDPRAAARTMTNSIGMDFVLIPAGSFTMGSDSNDPRAARNEMPAHRVTISRAFWLGRHEVTQAQWEVVMGSSPYDEKDRSNAFYNLPGMAVRIRKPDHPVTASWMDVQEFIRFLNAREGGTRYRLPTEAEWEYAARAGTTTAYSFGDDDQHLARYAWFGEDFDSGGTHPVGKKQPNSWGLYDMHGNVWEWVHDWYDPQYYAISPVIDPRGPDSGQEHVVRGGSWHQSATSWHTAFRRSYPPDYRGISIGLRLVLQS